MAVPKIFHTGEESALTALLSLRLRNQPQFLKNIIHYATDAPALPEQFFKTTIWLLLSLAIFLAVWHLQVTPGSRRRLPNAPVEIPSKIPYYGHLPYFLHNYSKTLERARLLTLRAAEPFFLLLGGMRICFVLSPEDVSMIHESSKFHNEHTLQDFGGAFGFSAKGAQRFFASRATAKRESITNFMAIIRRELGSLNRPSGIPDKTFRSLWHQTSWTEMPQKSIVSSGFDADGRASRTISLERWVRDTIAIAMTNATFGPAMLKLHPNLFEDFKVFDDNSWKMMYKVPSLPPFTMKRALWRIQKAFRSYLALPEDQKSELSQLIRNLEKAVADDGKFKAEELSVALSAFYWASNTNTWRASYWALCHLASDPTLVEELRAEVAPVMNKDMTPSDHASRLKKCPKLVSTIYEVLRFTGSTGSLRRSDGHASLAHGKAVPPDTDVAISYRMMHMNPTIFGDRINEFIWDRFLKDEELAKRPAFGPFGGGVGKCPGRFLAQGEICIIIARVLMLYDLELVSEMPILDTVTPPTGIMTPMAGQECLIKFILKEDGSAEWCLKEDQAPSVVN